MNINPLHPPLPKADDTDLRWENLSGAAVSLAIANLLVTQKKLLVLITSDVHSAEKYCEELQFFLKTESVPVYLFPDRETLPYDHFSPHKDLISDRLSLLAQLPKLTHGVVIAAVSTLMHRLPPTSFLQQYALRWSCGDTLDLTQTQTALAQSGYRHVEQVVEHGEFAVRGAIIDIFPMGSSSPYRVELFDDTIESIRTFDVDTQKSVEKIQKINLLPAHEYPLTEDAITHFRQAWRAQFSGNPAESPAYQHVSKGQPIAGIEYYLPLFFEKTDTFFNYLPRDTHIIFFNELSDKVTQFWNEVQTRYTQYNVDSARPLLEPTSVFIPVNSFFLQLKNFCKIRVEKKESSEFPDMQIHHRDKLPLKLLQNFLETHADRVLICAESAGRREILHELFLRHHIPLTYLDSWKDFLQHSEKLAITIAPISEPLWLKAEKIVLITETQLFGYTVIPARRQKKSAQDPATLIKSLAELQTNDLVVHIDHGIGKYIGLEKIKTDDVESEYVTLEYADQDRIYVPIQSLHGLSRYSAAQTESTPLNKLGAPQWEKTKRKAIAKIRDVAAELLVIYSERQAATGFSFAKPNEDFLTFRRAFPFEETDDQTQAINAVIEDMTQPKCMDRLICGDVGFGKTEVAMQAAFLAVSSGKQVVILVPTTLLANQHVENFRNRFAPWPIKIELMSRSQSTKEQNDIIEKIKNGKVDIVVGTHKLLNQQIRFQDLGLLVIDEEHRFGVQQKEKIKSLRAHVDILTLTATPIPRTLNLSMSGLRDLSIIATPPAKRLSIKTFVHEYDSALIREVVLRELMRGGQVYFLHNEVKTMPLMQEKLRKLIPEASMAIANGQMPERQLEKTMGDFYHQRFQLLICSTIIESGIDIPSANTIIINDANQFGLAQLHQIRGRVGRSHHQAYAYLLVPSLKTLTSEAEKRLDAIAELEDLGVGFQLATYDLEIRGAGELLGESQSGHMEAIGFSLYMELLDETVNALKAGKKPPETFARPADTEINLRISALFPENYIHDVHTRLTLYKRLSECNSEKEIHDIQSEMIDRFGLLPEPAQYLFQITQLKIIAKKLGVHKIEMNKEFGWIHFNEKPHVDPAIIINLIQKEYKNYQLAGKNVLRFKSCEDPAARMKLLENILKKIQ